MKRFVLFTLVFVIIFASISAFSASDHVTVVIDGNPLECKDADGNIVYPILVEGTTYLPVRAVATALNLKIEWDDATKSVFINGTPENAEKTDAVNIYINGVKLIPMDAAGKVVNPILQGGTTYLPVRAVSEAFNKKVSWEQDTHTVFLTTPETKDFEDGKVYAFINKANGKAISVTAAGLVTEEFNNYTYQGFKLTKTDAEGYYYINALANEKNFDVNGNSKNPGAKIITYNAGTADNQKFCVELTDAGYVIYALSSKLPIEDSAGVVKQNSRRDSVVQRWDVVEFTPIEKKDEPVLYKLTTDSVFTLAADGCDTWLLTPDENGEYIITNSATDKSLDVANNSKTAGDPVITYSTSGDPNQRWILENQGDGSFLIRSVHSSLYLTLASDASIVQSDINSSYKQKWTISVVK